MAGAGHGEAEALTLAALLKRIEDLEAQVRSLDRECSMTRIIGPSIESMRFGQPAYEPPPHVHMTPYPEPAEPWIHVMRAGDILPDPNTSAMPPYVQRLETTAAPQFDPASIRIIRAGEIRPLIEVIDPGE